MIWGHHCSEFTEKYQYKVITLTIVSAKSEDIANGFNKLMVDYQEELAGFNKSEAMIILFSKLFKDKAMKWYQSQNYTIDQLRKKVQLQYVHCLILKI